MTMIQATHARNTYDWSGTELGSPETWPYTLRLTVDIMLATPLPMLLDWGDKHISVYNEAYAALADSRFVRAPGGKVSALRPAPVAAANLAFARAHAGEQLVLQRQAISFLRDTGTESIECDLHLMPVCDQLASVCGVLCTLQVSPPAMTVHQASGLRVLVVEDNLDSQYLVCEMLRAFGHAPDGVGHSEAALVLLEQHRYDVLFSDVSLPGMSGVELAKRAIVQQPELKVIFASGYGDTLLRQLEFPYQSLQKPYELDQLQNALSQIAQQRHGGV